MIQVLWRMLINGFEERWKPGQSVDGLQIISYVGSGSYGSTYTVRLPDVDPAILKRLRPYKKLFSNHVQYVENEVKALQILSHPQFPSYIGSGDFNGTPYMLMEKMEGRTFEELIFQEGKKYSEAESLQLGLQLMELVDWIHQKGWVHRDLRIPNILYHQGSLNIIDFGLACEMQGEGEEKFTHRDYMRVKSNKSDFYAIGHFYCS